MFDIRARLTDPALPSRVEDLGFRGEDGPDLLAAVAEVLDRPDDLDWIARNAERMQARIGDFGSTAEAGCWSEPERPSTGSGHSSTGSARTAGLLPMLTLLATAPDLSAYHSHRGISPEISRATLADLGQQVWVHRQTYGEFGLHTHDWLCWAWSGSLYWLGRLQFGLQFEEPAAGRSAEWVLSVHIPRSGPLTRESVDDSFAAATDFFARYFPEYPTREFICQSWMLDPQLATLVPESNLADFQQRWRLSGDAQPGDADVFFFVFNQRGPVDIAALPRDTALRRAIADGLAAGQHWSVAQGRLPQREGGRDA